MDDAKSRETIADEAATENDYKQGMKKRAKDFRAGIRAQERNLMTSNVNEDLPENVELIGRVALSKPEAAVDDFQDFYIGTTKYESDQSGYLVFSWAAPIAACTFYNKKPDRDALIPLSDSVIGIRSFSHHVDQISDFADEVLVVEPATTDLFPKRQLSIPAAPPATAIEIPAKDLGKGTSDGLTESPNVLSKEMPVLVPKVLPNVSTVQKPRLEAPPPGPPLRVSALLRRELSRPKSRRLSTVLSTLQTDQYRVITEPVDENLIIQGHPGTGKTIIAVHRAAYLLYPESEGDRGSEKNAKAKKMPQGKILIVGPTTEYVDHVNDALAKLIDSEKYEAVSLPDLLDRLAGLSTSRVPTNSFIYEDVSPDLVNLVDIAVTRSKARDDSSSSSPEAIYEELLGLLHNPPDDGLDANWVQYLRSLPPTLQELKNQRLYRYRGLLAYIGIRAERFNQKIGHIIVDEGQDVHPIEWHILGWLGNSGGWTILGDLNQRRTDHTFNNWDQVANIFGIENSEGNAPVQILERGYRSTAQILKFANQLLPKEDRSIYSIQQDGEAPKVHRIAAKGEMISEAVNEAELLCERVGAGTVAVITPDITPFQRAIVKRGWKLESTEAYIWNKDGRTIRLLTPDRARGLEFDGVVVIEPADFPENLGRQGVLYTALTRANRFLTVVYHNPLPQGMKSKV